MSRTGFLQSNTFWNVITAILGVFTFAVLSGIYNVGFIDGPNMNHTSVVFGLGATFTMFAVFGALYWWLLKSPMPEQQSVVTARLMRILHVVAFIALLAALVWIAGGIGDGFLHASRGGFKVPFDDFKTVPHLIIYGSFVVDLLIATGAIAVLLGMKIGSRKNSFRGMARLLGPLTLFALLAIFLVVSGEHDEYWHGVYGKDIRVWSEPHVILLLMSTWLALVGIALAVYGLNMQQKLPVLNAMLVFGFIFSATWTLWAATVSEYEWFHHPEITAELLTRAWWFYPMTCYTLFAGFGMLLYHITKRAWMIPALALAMLALRIGEGIYGVPHIEAARTTATLGPDVPMNMFSFLFNLPAAFALFFALRWLEKKQQAEEVSRLTAFMPVIVYTVAYWVVAIPVCLSIPYAVPGITLGGLISWLFVLAWFLLLVLYRMPQFASKFYTCS